MGVFLLPSSLCQDLERKMCRFWWQTNSKKEKCIHWLSWSNLSKTKVSGGMGFRNLRDFNIALLGKQGWRLLHHPEKLVSKVFKARYYPNGSFLNAKIGSNPSYIWRSILESQNLSRQGVGCKVGSGESINILEDPWLPSEHDPNIHTRHPALQGQRLCSLKDSENNWDIDLIRDVFDSRDVQLIMTIHLNNETEDTWYWRKEKLGDYSVKSAYVLIQELKHSHDLNPNSGFWRKLWNLKIPSKIKIFLWRTATNTLPTKDQLRSKRVPVSALCPTCNTSPETALHTLVDCTFALNCWSQIQGHLITGEYNSFLQWFHLVLQQQDKEQSLITAVACWMLWKQRNELVWNQRSLTTTEVVKSAASILDQWRSVQDRTFDPFMGFMTQHDGDGHLHKPSVNSIKINADAAIFADTCRFSHAIVNRDHEGGLVEARSVCRQGCVTPELAEAFGIKEALSWAMKNTNKDIVVESDCLQLVQAIRSSLPGLSYLGRVIQQCRDLITSLQHKNICLRFVKRSANKVAHYLARYSSSIADRIWRVGDVHSDFHHVLLEDLNE